MRRRDVLRASAGTLLLPLAGRVRGRPDSYEPLGTLAMDGAKEAVVGDDGTTVFVALTDGFGVADVSDPTNPSKLYEERDLLADREGGPLQQIYDVKVDGDTLIVVGPANATREGDAVRGMLVYDVSDPANPERRAFYETDYPIHNSYVTGGVAYLTGNDGGRNPLVMVDVSGSEPSKLGEWSPVDHDDAWADVPSPVRPLHDVWVQDGTAYLAYWDAGTFLVDVSDPANPAFLSRVGDYDAPADLAEQVRRDNVVDYIMGLPGNAHYVTVNDDASLMVVGEEAWDRQPDDDQDAGPGGVALWDISDPANPEKLSEIAPPPTPDPAYDGVWTTAHNCELSGGRLYTSWYQGGVKIHDVSDPANPQELAWWRQPTQTSFWTAQLAADCVVGSSRMNPEQSGQRSSKGAALFTFPDRAGQQPNPPTLVNGSANGTTTAGPTTANATTTATTTETSTSTATTSTTTTATTTRTATETTAESHSAPETNATTTDGTTGTTTESGGQPGFGVAAAVGAVALGAWRALRE